MTQDFWLQKHLWPSDPADYVFLTRAVNRIGQAMFGSEWDGREPTAKPVHALPERGKAEARDELRAYEILKAISPDFVARERDKHADWKPKHDPRTGRLLPASDKMTADDWLVAQKHVQGQNDAIAPALRRFIKVQQEIARACEAGELVSALRPSRGGTMQTVPRQFWNTERWRDRFIWCQMNPKDPFSIGFAGENFCWIFITAESLEKFVSLRPFSKLASETLSHLSPYMRVLLAVAKELEITPENQPLKKIVSAAIESRWTGEPLSEKLLDAMGTILREPNSRLGKAKKTQPGRPKG